MKSLMTLLTGIMLGVVGTYVYFIHISAADIIYNCSSSTTKYECQFFNKGNLGAMCIKVLLRRSAQPSEYEKQSDSTVLYGDQICSGPLEKGKEGRSSGSRFWADTGQSTDATAYCKLKGKDRALDGCALDFEVVARTH